MTAVRLGRRAFLAGLPALAAAPASAAEPRVVALDLGLAETLLALGIVPVGMPGSAEYRAWVVEPVLPVGVADLGQRTQPNLELVAALKPHLILAVQDHDPVLPQLGRIAPVLRLPIYTPQRRPWEQATEAARRIAERLGRPETAERLISDVEERYATARAALAGRDVRPLLLASLTDARHLRVYGPGSILQAALDRLGLRNAWSGRTGIWGSATLGLEALASMEEAALFTFEPQPPDLVASLAGSPLWRALPLVRAGRVQALPPVLMFGTLPAADRFAKVLLPYLASAAHQAARRA